MATKIRKQFAITIEVESDFAINFITRFLVTIVDILKHKHKSYNAKIIDMETGFEPILDDEN